MTGQLVPRDLGPLLGEKEVRFVVERREWKS